MEEITLKEIYDRHGKELGDLAVKRANEYAEKGLLEELEEDFLKEYKEKGLLCGISWAFDWRRTDEAWGFWSDVCDRKSIEELKKEHPKVFKGMVEEGDSVVNSVVEQFNSRSKTGIDKYGVTLDRNDLKPLEWLQHLQEELMDATLYIEKLKKELEAIQ